MSRRYGGTRGRVLATVGAVTVLTLGTGGCKGIDERQWAPGNQSSVGDRGNTTDFRPSTARTAPNSTVGGSGRSVRSGTAGSGTLGVVAGSGAGARTRTTSNVALRAPAGTCWVLTIDGFAHYGCGNAALTDTRGTAAARALKRSGDGAVRVSITTRGRVADTGTVRGANRYVTVIDRRR